MREYEPQRLTKGMRVRKYTDSSKKTYKDGTVIKGTNGAGLAIVKWDGEKISDFNVNIYEVYVLKER